MMKFESFASVMRSDAIRNWVGAPVVTAVYASSGRDTFALVLTHPDFYASRGVDPASAPNVFVYLDRAPQRDPEFNDGQTRVSVIESQDVTISGLRGRVLLTRYEAGPQDERGYPPRQMVVVALEAANETANVRMQSESWVPDVFIGVCDGCRFGGNDHCVNELTNHGMPPEVTARISLPTWWITDHFGKARTETGAVYDSTEPGFPVRFEKVALLSMEWGRYGGGTLPGATVFRVVSVGEIR